MCRSTTTAGAQRAGAPPAGVHSILNFPALQQGFLKDLHNCCSEHAVCVRSLELAAIKGSSALYIVAAHCSAVVTQSSACLLQLNIVPVLSSSCACSLK